MKTGFNCYETEEINTNSGNEGKTGSEKGGNDFVEFRIGICFWIKRRDVSTYDHFVLKACCIFDYMRGQQNNGRRNNEVIFVRFSITEQCSGAEVGKGVASPASRAAQNAPGHTFRSGILISRSECAERKKVQRMKLKFE